MEEQRKQKKLNRNLTEKQRREVMKECFNNLKNAVPSLERKLTVPRVMILENTAEYIKNMTCKNVVQMNEICELQRQNSLLETQIQALEACKDKFDAGSRGPKNKQVIHKINSNRDVEEKTRFKKRN